MTPVTTCTYASPGTYGHECGKPAVKIAVIPSNITESGDYYAGRCAECASRDGPENAGIIRWEPPHGQVNRYLYGWTVPRSVAE